MPFRKGDAVGDAEATWPSLAHLSRAGAADGLELYSLEGCAADFDLCEVDNLAGDAQHAAVQARLVTLLLDQHAHTWPAAGPAAAARGGARGSGTRAALLP